MSESNSSGPRVSGAEDKTSLIKRLGGFVRRGRWHRNGEATLRDALEELIEESERQTTSPEIDANERMLLGNILKLRDLTVYDIMIPRADVVAVHVEAGFDDVVAVVSEASHSRMPVYRKDLDDAVGMVHIKDILTWSGGAQSFDLAKIMRTVLFVVPSMRVLDLLLQMRLQRIHMALVVDEFGGIDGLITIEDVVETIVGEIEDEHDAELAPRLHKVSEGVFLADARVPLETLTEHFGDCLTELEREEDIDTIGGLVFNLAGRVPSRGELIEHESGLVFEIVEADPRRIKRLRIRATSSGRHAAPAPPALLASDPLEEGSGAADPARVPSSVTLSGAGGPPEAVNDGSASSTEALGTLPKHDRTPVTKTTRSASQSRG